MDKPSWLTGAPAPFAPVRPAIQAGPIAGSTCDQHKGYAESVREDCPQADLVWDRFHLAQSFNGALNEERKIEWVKYKDPERDGDDLLAGKYRYVYLTKSKNSSEADRQHLQAVMSRNTRIAMMEMIKEHFHKMFEDRRTQSGKSKEYADGMSRLVV